MNCPRARSNPRCACTRLAPGNTRSQCPKEWSARSSKSACFMRIGMGNICAGAEKIAKGRDVPSRAIGCILEGTARSRSDLPADLLQGRIADGS
jgi:hypothetical protein